jgi:hypothetical protein
VSRRFGRESIVSPQLAAPDHATEGDFSPATPALVPAILYHSPMGSPRRRETETVKDDEEADSRAHARVVYLLGAGASVPAGIPHTRDLVTLIANKCPTRLKRPLKAVLEHLRDWANPRNVVLDIELIYETLVRLSESEKDAILASATGLDKLASREAANALREFVERTIRGQMYAREERLKYLEPLRSVVVQYGHLDIFSTNYDTCIELLCERLRLLWEDGFAVRWDPSTFDRPAVQVKLHKLHGSVLWFRDQAGGQFRSLLSAPPDASAKQEWIGGKCEPFLLYPARKSGYDAPYFDNLSAFRAALGKEDKPVVLAVIGYSFRDAAIRQAVFDAARKNRLLTVVLVDPESEAIYESNLQYVEPRSTVASPLRDRLVPYGVGLDQEGRVTRRLVNQVTTAAMSAHTGERELVESDATSENGFWGVAASNYLAAGHLRGYWRCLARKELDIERTSFDEAFPRLLSELRLIIAFGMRVPAARRLSDFVQAVITRWCSGVAVNAQHGRFRLRLIGAIRDTPHPRTVARHMRNAASDCDVDADCLSANTLRQGKVTKLGEMIRRAAEVVSTCLAVDGRDDIDLDELKNAVQPYRTPEGNVDECADHVTIELQRRYEDCFVRYLHGMAEFLTDASESA